MTPEKRPYRHAWMCRWFRHPMPPFRQAPVGTQAVCPRCGHAWEVVDLTDKTSASGMFSVVSAAGWRSVGNGPSMPTSSTDERGA